jgi:hypothetical protein
MYWIHLMLDKVSVGRKAVVDKVKNLWIPWKPLTSLERNILLASLNFWVYFLQIEVDIQGASKRALQLC